LWQLLRLFQNGQKGLLLASEILDFSFHLGESFTQDLIVCLATVPHDRPNFLPSLLMVNICVLPVLTCLQLHSLTFVFIRANKAH
jgi:hypothetical protein